MAILLRIRNETRRRCNESYKVNESFKVTCKKQLLWFLSKGYYVDKVQVKIYKVYLCLFNMGSPDL